MPQFCSNLQIHVNGEQTFFLKERILSAYSGRLKKIIKEAKKRSQIRKSSLEIEIDEFPGGPDGFELVSRFCYNNGKIKISASNVSVLHCSAVFLGMTEKLSIFNLLQQTEYFLKGIYRWSWNDIIISLKSCESFFTYADSYGLVQNLVSALLAKISQNSDMNIIACSSSSSSSPETPFRLSFSSKTTPESIKLHSRSTKEWWFDDVASLGPQTIEKVLKNLGAYGTDNDSLILTIFLLHYLKTTVQSKSFKTSLSSSSPDSSSSSMSKGDYVGLVETAVHGVVLVGKPTFSCRKLFWVLRIVSGFSLNKDCRAKLERLIGEILDQATLDDLLVSGAATRDKGVYNVNLVIRLLKEFVNYIADHDDGVSSAQKMKKVWRLIDKYLGEISPDQNLKVSKFLGVAECLPDYAKDCFDGVYRAIDIYLESHPSLSMKEKLKLCRCLNYEKLTLETCKDLAKNPRIPPNITVQALISQRSKLPKPKTTEIDHQRHRYDYDYVYDDNEITPPLITCKADSQQFILYKKLGISSTTSSAEDQEAAVFEEESEDMKTNIQRMQWRVVELEKVCREMKGQMSKMVMHDHNSSSNAMITGSPWTLPRFC